MRLLPRFLSSKLRSIWRTAESKSSGPLREFVYLDEVSVYSLLASRQGGVKTEIIENETVFSERAANASLGANVVAAEGKLSGQFKSGQSRGTQVVRKAIVQTSFKELYEIEQEKLTLSRPKGDPPNTLSEIENSNRAKDWVQFAAQIERGCLIEVDVVLEADPLFRMAAITTMLSELAEGNESLFRRNLGSQLERLHSIARILDSLLVGLIPIRARLLDYKSVNVGGREALVHDAVLDSLSDCHLIPIPVFLVATLERELFWKDIRRLLFSGGRFTVFCRPGHVGLMETWRPVKGADVLSGLPGGFDQAFRDFGELARNSLTANQDRSGPSSCAKISSIRVLLQTYVEWLFEFHGLDVENEIARAILEIAPSGVDWLGSVDERRSVFGEIACRFDKLAGVKTTPEDQLTLRKRVLAEIAGNALNPRLGQSAQGQPDPMNNHDERYLECDVVAIYW